MVGRTVIVVNGWKDRYSSQWLVHRTTVYQLICSEPDTSEQMDQAYQLVSVGYQAGIWMWN